MSRSLIELQNGCCLPRSGNGKCLVLEGTKYMMHVDLHTINAWRRVCNPFAPHSCRNPGSFFPYLQDYKQKYPDVIVLDPPEAIQHLRNRQSMLQDVTQLDLCDCGGLTFLFLQNSARSDSYIQSGFWLMVWWFPCLINTQIISLRLIPLTFVYSPCWPSVTFVLGSEL